MVNFILYKKQLNMHNMEKQQTAVEWLLEKYKSQNTLLFADDFEQAKEMEKEQIITSWHNGYENQSPMIDEDNCGQQYYNETFKNK